MHSLNVNDINPFDGNTQIDILVPMYSSWGRMCVCSSVREASIFISQFLI